MYYFTMLSNEERGIIYTCIDSMGDILSESIESHPLDKTDLDLIDINLIEFTREIYLKAVVKALSVGLNKEFNSADRKEIEQIFERNRVKIDSDVDEVRKKLVNYLERVMDKSKRHGFSVISRRIDKILSRLDESYHGANELLRQGKKHQHFAVWCFYCDGKIFFEESQQNWEEIQNAFTKEIFEKIDLEKYKRLKRRKDKPTLWQPTDDLLDGLIYNLGLIFENIKVWDYSEGRYIVFSEQDEDWPKVQDILQEHFGTYEHPNCER